MVYCLCKKYEQGLHADLDEHVLTCMDRKKAELKKERLRKSNTAQIFFSFDLLISIFDFAKEAH
jgi:hypothetical protein